MSNVVNAFKSDAVDFVFGCTRYDSCISYVVGVRALVFEFSSLVFEFSSQSNALLVSRLRHRPIRHSKKINA